MYGQLRQSAIGCPTLRREVVALHPCQPAHTAVCKHSSESRCSLLPVFMLQHAPKALRGARCRLPSHVPSVLGKDHISARAPIDPHPSLINEDFEPTTAQHRTFDFMDFATLWITLVISITTWYLAASLVDLGMSWWQGVGTILIGNMVVLLPMVLNGHPGAKYGVPFPVLARASFGIWGANLPSLSRALVACGWFGIQTWVGGNSIYQMLVALSKGAIVTSAVSWLGISLPELGCFMAFWAAQVWIVLKGMEAIRLLEKYSAPLLMALSLALLAWAVGSAGGFGPMLSAPSRLSGSQFWTVFWPSVTANVGFWLTLSLNIPDFTRYAKSQRDQVLGQALGLPLFMALFTFLGLAVTSATVVLYGAPIVDPVQLLGKMQGLVPICLALFGLMWATLTTNIAANVVAPANAIVNVNPERLSFNQGAFITAVLGAIIMPWKLVSSTSSFISTWLVGYSTLLGPIIGIVMADYWIVRRCELDIDALYRVGRKSAYWYQGGWNTAALLAMLLGVLPCLPGLLQQVGLISGLPSIFGFLYDVSAFVGVLVGGAVYCLLMPARGQAQGQSATGLAGA